MSKKSTRPKPAFEIKSVQDLLDASDKGKIKLTRSFYVELVTMVQAIRQFNGTVQSVVNNHGDKLNELIVMTSVSILNELRTLSFITQELCDDVKKHLGDEKIRNILVRFHHEETPTISEDLIKELEVINNEISNRSSDNAKGETKEETGKT